MPSRYFFWLFSPKPLSGATCPNTHAVFNASTDSIPNDSCKIRALFGPKPGIPTISIKPGGILSYNDCISPQVPCITASVIKPPIPLPIPLISTMRFSDTTVNKSSSMEAKVREPF